MLLILTIAAMLYFQNAPEQGKAFNYSDKLADKPLAGGGVYRKEDFT
ncbi:MAG: hypothetical protein ACO3FI_00215 [Cyclobacteriaceae bacterium]